LLRHRILPDASPSSLFASSAQQDHALEVFSLLDADNSGEIDAEELGEMLRMLDIDASDSDAAALFKYLAKSGNRGIGFDDFAPWYADASSDARSSADAVQAIIRSRRACVTSIRRQFRTTSCAAPLSAPSPRPIAA